MNTSLYRNTIDLSDLIYTFVSFLLLLTTLLTTIGLQVNIVNVIIKQT